jgi:hypothetical protein
MMADETAAEAERAAEAAPFVDAETFGVDATEGTAADPGRRHPFGPAAEGDTPSDEGFPLGGYLAATGVYAGSMGVIALVARLTRRPVAAPTTWDVVVSAAATYRLGHLDTRGDAPGERPKRGVRLLTHPSCTGMWVVTGLSAGYVFAPRTTRLAAAGLAALTGSDFLRYARDRLG